MTDRADKRLAFKPLNHWPFLHGETEPCINGRILALPHWKSASDSSTRQGREELPSLGFALLGAVCKDRRFADASSGRSAQKCYVGCIG
jgi:hypothetical protein